MNSTSTPKAIEPHQALIASADETLAHAHEQIVRADEELARLSEQLAKMERDTTRPPAGKPAPPSRSGRPALRGLVGFLLAACVVVAALVLQSSYGHEVKQVVARWAPRLVSTPSLPPSGASPERHTAKNVPLPTQPAPPILKVAAADAAPPQATPPAQTAPQDAAPTATATPLDNTQLLQAMARDLANLERNIEQLKANQQQITSDNSKAIEELKASQDDIKRVLAKVFEQNLSRTSSASSASSLPPRPAPALRKPERSLPSPYVRERPRPPRDYYYDDDW